MELKIETIKPGDYVKVKDGIKDPDFEYQLMNGWQGKVVDVQKDHNLVVIKWDTKTLLNTPYEYLNDIIKQGYDCELMTLSISELEMTEKRNESVEDKVQLEAKIYWIDLYDDENKNRKYGKLFSGINMSNYNELYQKWEEYLSENLIFPFEVEVLEAQRGEIRTGAKIKLLDVEDYDDMYGIFGIGKHERAAVTFPICDLEATDKKSNNHELLRDYAIWFANM
jgi:ribosomal protein L24